MQFMYMYSWLLYYLQSTPFSTDTDCYTYCYRDIAIAKRLHVSSSGRTKRRYMTLHFKSFAMHEISVKDTQGHWK